MSYKKNIDNISNKVDSLLLSSDKNQTKNKLDESLEEYTQEELIYLDKYQALTNYKLDDDDLYEIIKKYDFNDDKIREELEVQKKIIEVKGEDYSWNTIKNGKSNNIFNKSIRTKATTSSRTEVRAKELQGKKV